jgi:hypothetical protein
LENIFSSLQNVGSDRAKTRGLKIPLIFIFLEIKHDPLDQTHYIFIPGKQTWDITYETKKGKVFVFIS